ncbi:polysaccharide deacetylase [Halostagnicola larsenii XH-48]|uniref:Polysaccharide deacetylase n=1 Tax=Halostagnicola larsenii XH-48 TaxID=797299 RepID=W0JIK5_9EURY|nr:polysaccharide deacetylase [Halostagnicola larsenii]AHF98433.1 polysaccharide deacetylase [Halostagnicola larsenii XH-48]
MDIESSRRRMLAAVGVGSASLAGCLDFLSDGGGDGDGDGDGSGNGGNGDGAAWPASNSGELISDFGEDDNWVSRHGEIKSAPDEAVTGDQAMVIESDKAIASAGLAVPDGVDLEDWDASMAVKVESATDIRLEVLASGRENHLTSIRQIPDAYEGWLRVDFGYIMKRGEPDLSNVTQFNIVASGPEGGPTRVVVDDLRRTEAAVSSGKAILAFYDGLPSHFDIAADMLEERGWAGAVPVDPDRIGGAGRMNISQLQQLSDQGWDVCSYPESDGPLPEQSEERQRERIQQSISALESYEFEDGARHFFAPGDSMDETTHEIVREHHESGFLFGASPNSTSPTGPHMTSLIWGPDLHGGVRRAINLSDQYNQLTVLRIPDIVEDEADVNANNMPLEDFEHLLDHLEHRGVDVITPSDLVDGSMESDEEGGSEGDGDGPILEAGKAHTFSGNGGSQTDEFDLASSGVECSFSHEGSGDFVVEATAIDGDLANDLLVDTTGSGPGKSFTFADEGTYQLEVEADGEWSIELDQPEVTNSDLTSLPVSESGTGSSFIGPLESEDDISLEVSHDGDGAFLIDGFDSSGSREQVVNKTGQFEGSRSYAVGDATWFNIEATGDWELAIE